VSPLEALALFLLVVVVLVLVTFVAIVAFAQIWHQAINAAARALSRRRHLRGENARLELKLRLLEERVQRPAEEQVADLFRFNRQHTMPFDWRGDRAFSGSGRKPR
jgi:hypothetical protein